MGDADVVFDDQSVKWSRAIFLNFGQRARLEGVIRKTGGIKQNDRLVLLYDCGNICGIAEFSLFAPIFQVLLRGCRAQGSCGLSRSAIWRNSKVSGLTLSD
jgi:hypothetical protein